MMDTFEYNNLNNETDPAAQDQNPGERIQQSAEAGQQTPEPEHGCSANGPCSGTQDPWSFPGNQKRAPKEPKKKKGAGRVVALALTCAILGSIGGGIGVDAVLSARYEKQNQVLQQQIDDLKENSKGDTTILTAVSAEGLKSGAQIYEENVDAVVSVSAKGNANSNGYGFESRGTGFLISSEGFLLTNQHVIANADTISVTTNDGTKYEAKLMGSDAYFDVALLKIEGENLPAVTIGDSDQVAVGEQVVAIGNALGQLSSTFTGGYLSGVNRMVSTDGKAINMMQTDAAINSGNSGGPLFNMSGQVIGITSAKYSGSSSTGASIEGIGFAIPINDVMELVSDLRDYGYVKGQAYLGITASNVALDKDTAAMYGLPLGVQVKTVDEGSAAEKAGIQPKDIITALGEDTVENMDDLTVALRHHKAGDTDTITVYREGKELPLTITFDEKVVAPAQPEQTQPQQEQAPQMPSQNGSWDEWFDFFNRYFNGQ